MDPRFQGVPPPGASMIQNRKIEAQAIVWATVLYSCVKFQNNKPGDKGEVAKIVISGRTDRRTCVRHDPFYKLVSWRLEMR